MVDDVAGESTSVKRPTATELQRFLSGPAAGIGTVGGGDVWPKISIVSPSFNQARFLEKMILSVINQGYPHVEIIIIDGGSTDGSVEIIRAHEAWLSYWRSNEDGGQAAAVNEGLSRASGELVGWQNSDDLYLPGAFHAAARLFQARPSVDIVFGNTVVIDETDTIIDELRFTPFSVLAHLYEGTSINNQSAFMRRSLFSRVGLLDERLKFSMDFEFFLRAAKESAKFMHLRQYLGAFRIHPRSKTSTVSSLATQDHTLIERQYRRRELAAPWLRQISRLRRAIYYCSQGDADYCLRPFVRQVRRIGRALGRKGSTGLENG